MSQKQIDLPGLPDFEQLLTDAIQQKSALLGNSSVRRTQVIHIALQLLDEQIAQVSADQWIEMYECYHHWRNFDKRIPCMIGDSTYQRIERIRAYILQHERILKVVGSKHGTHRISNRMIAVFAVIYQGMQHAKEASL